MNVSSLPLVVALSLVLSAPFVIGDDAVASLQGGKVTGLFDGESLEGWRGRDDLWSVEDGMIVGRTTQDDPIQQNTFLICNEPTEGNFELTCQFKIEGGNSGIQYRSEVIDEEKFIVRGYQADFDFTNKFAGILYEEKGRGILSMRGQEVTIGEDGKKEVQQISPHKDFANAIHPGQWNDYRIVARGHQLEQFINETQTVKVIDQQTGKARDSGVIALQLHKGPAMVVRFKNITLRRYQ